MEKRKIVIKENEIVINDFIHINTPYLYKECMHILTEECEYDDFLDADTQSLIEHLHSRTFMYLDVGASKTMVNLVINNILSNTVGMKISDIKTIAKYKVMYNSIKKVTHDDCISVYSWS